MATYLDLDIETPEFGLWWVNPVNDERLWLIDRSFRSNRMVCLMESPDGSNEYFVFPYN